MKHVYVVLIGLLLAHIAEAKIWRVDNRAGYLADFQDMQPAHDAASAGDTIMVSGSATGYGGVTAEKRLVWIGPGYLWSENYPNYPEKNSALILNTVTFNNGSGGSSFVGFESVGGVLYLYINTNDVTVSRCKGFFISFSSVNNVAILNSIPYDITVSGVNSGIIISNSILNSISISAGSEAIIKNNVFTSYVSIINQTLVNNILTGSSEPDLTGSTFSNNIDARNPAGAAFGTANGNQGNLDHTSVFIGPTGNSTDGQWKLKAGSPALGAGQGGTDCGIFGGETPYVLSGLPPIPVFTKLISSGTGSNSTPLSIVISVKSNN